MRDAQGGAGRAVLLLALLTFGMTPAAVRAQTVGTTNTVTAEPALPRPSTKPVTVTLFRHLAFNDYTPKTFSYSPPVGDGRHWAKILLVADYSVPAGRQYDRTARIAIGNTNVYFGTTAEPSAGVGQSWHVERDLTDDSALLRKPHSGEADLGNIVNATYTGVIHGSASLLFFPADKDTPAPEAPDVVLPLPNTASGTAGLLTANSVVTGNYTFPTNVVRAYLDVITQSQGADEFWYFGVPDSLAAFREAEVTVDGKPAGVAPIFPWIYTGGIDPRLWRPIPGVQTLDFTPFRADLTPFAGVFNDGKSHRVGLRVFNSHNYFQVAGVLLLYCDSHRKKVPGALTEDTLSATPTPVVQQNLVTAGNGRVSGPLSVSSARKFALAGYVLTSHGRVDTRIVGSTAFSNRQQFATALSGGGQNLQQQTTYWTATTTRRGRVITKRRTDFSYPLAIRVSYQSGTGQAPAQTVSVHQEYRRDERVWRNGHLVFSSRLSDAVDPFSAGRGAAGGPRHTNRQTYSYDDSDGNRYQRTLTAANGVLTGVTNGRNTEGHSTHDAMGGDHH